MSFREAGRLAVSSLYTKLSNWLLATYLLYRHESGINVLKLISMDICADWKHGTNANKVPFEFQLDLRSSPIPLFFFSFFKDYFL